MNTYCKPKSDILTSPWAPAFLCVLILLFLFLLTGCGSGSSLSSSTDSKVGKSGITYTGEFKGANGDQTNVEATVDLSTLGARQAAVIQIHAQGDQVISRPTGLELGALMGLEGEGTGLAAYHAGDSDGDQLGNLKSSGMIVWVWDSTTDINADVVATAADLNKALGANAEGISESRHNVIGNAVEAVTGLVEGVLDPLPSINGSSSDTDDAE